MTETERQIVNMAIGRIFMLASRPEQVGDDLQYEKCRRVVLDLVEPANEIYESRYLTDGFCPIQVERAYVEQLHVERRRAQRRRPRSLALSSHQNNTLTGE